MVEFVKRLTAACVLLIACSRSPSPPSIGSQTTTSAADGDGRGGGSHQSEEEKARMADLHLTAEAHVDQGILSLTYRVENSSDRDVYLLNRVHDNSLLPKANIVYVELFRAERTLHAYKDVPPIPDGFSPVMPHFPYVTPLRAKQSVSETLSIPVPVREFRAYVAKAPEVVEARYDRLRFSLGYYWSVPGMKEDTRKLQDGTEVVVPRAPPGFRLENGTLETSLPLSVSVLEPKSR